MKMNNDRFPSKQMYPYLSLVERKVAEFYHYVDRKRWLVWVKMTYFHRFFRTIPGVLENSSRVRFQTTFSPANSFPVLPNVCCQQQASKSIRVAQITSSIRVVCHSEKLFTITSIDRTGKEEANRYWMPIIKYSTLDMHPVFN